MPEINSLSMDLTTMILPWVAILISLIVAIWFKDFATGMAKGLKFKMNKAFNAGDQVILDGQDAVIVSIGTTETVFGIYSEKGYTWRYVPNERIAMLKLEKVYEEYPERFNKFNETYDMYGDGTEGKVIEFLKDRFPDAYKKALEEAKQNDNPDVTPEEDIIPSMIWGYIKNDDEFYSAVESWFKETYPDEEFK